MSLADLRMIHWGHGTPAPAAREGDCFRCGKPLDDTPAKTIKVEDRWIHRRCLRVGDDHPYAPREDRTGQLRVDLHGHPTSYAVYELVPALIEAAWSRGYRSVKLIHGSPDVQSHRVADLRGGTKWGLRAALNRGDWNRWAWGGRSVKHQGLEPNSGAMILALRPNPSPDPSFPWPSEEEPAYDYEGAWHRREVKP